MVLTLSYVHCRMVFLHIERKQFETAEIYALNFENRKWWLNVLYANKRFGGKQVDEEGLPY